MSSLERISDEIWQISLAAPAGLPELLSEPMRIYVLTGSAPALINAGHPCQVEALRAALRELQLDLGAIERVLYTSWDIAQLGASVSIPNADHFVLSPDMVEPGQYETLVEARRQELRTLARALVELQVGYGADDLEEVERMLGIYLPPMPASLQFIPLRNAQTVRAADFEFEVLATPGPAPGHAAFYDAARRTLFAGGFTTMGIPRQIREVQPYLISLERLQKLGVDALFLNTEPPVLSRGDWSVRRALRFLNNFMSTAPSAMHAAPTVVEFIESDLGHRIDSLPQMLLQVERYRVPMDELVRARMIEAEGQGLGRRYGIDVEDDRALLRR